ncbi:MAG: helix-turn-helix domain-containing protein [Alteromonadaceae bacterium]|nr:helix-turn-helix domain-containing protein [Alteromonadaceae bacterium]
MDFSSPYQLAMILGLLVWFVPLMQIWVRHDSMPHATQVLLSVLLMPFIMADEVLKAFDLQTSAPFLIGVFQFLPVLIVGFLFVAVHKIVKESPLKNHATHYLLGFLFLAAEAPFLFLTATEKLDMLNEPLIGDVFNYWPFYLFYLLSNLVILGYAIKMDEMLKHYQETLPDQVVDLQHYDISYAPKWFSGLITVAFGSILLVLVVAPGLIKIESWQGIISLMQTCIIYVLVMVLLRKRRHSPNPIDYENLKYNKFSEEQLRIIIAKAEAAVLRHKAYKHLGLRLRELADVAHVTPEELVVATKVLLNRDFKAYMYHYRLQYARKIIMRSDIKISAIAKRLGFKSEKELSDMFVKYIQAIPERDPEMGEAEPNPFSQA